MDQAQWKRLQTLRQSYLKAQGDLPDYWQDEALLRAYDETLGMRIRWKWRSVLASLPSEAPRWPRTLVDWGCGAGGASREFLTAFPGQIDELVLFDRSRKAMTFAAAQVRSEVGAGLRISHVKPSAPYVLLISHVLSELPESELAKLMPWIQGAESVLWVEAGRPQESRRLSSIRETLRPTHTMLAPCPHQALCGMLRPGQEENWCHFTAAIPREVHQSAFWRECAKQLGFDLRSLPVSYLFAVRGGQPQSDQEKVRILAGSRSYKGYCRYNGCHHTGVVQKDFLKRHSKSLYQTLDEPGLELLLTPEELGWNQPNNAEEN